MSKAYVTAILSADWHLSHTPPVCRSMEDNWYETQAGYIRQVKYLADGKPILVAGDIFHRWNPPVELVNSVIGWLSGMKIYTIPGQHDLPNHRYEDLHRSGYWTLMQADAIHHVCGELCLEDTNLRLHALPYGYSVRALENPHDLIQEIAMVHEYIWTSSTGYSGAPESNRLKNKWSNFKGYDVIVIGDNHKPFIYPRENQQVVNAGSLMRRDITQKDYKPCVWKLYSDNQIEPHHLDISQDKFIDSELTQEKLAKTMINGMKLGEFMDTLKDVKEVSIDFEESVKRFLRANKVHPEVEKIILSALEESK